MRLTRRMRLTMPVAAALGLALFTASLAWQVPAASAASGPLDAQSSELVRLINGARSAYGKSALRVDTFLASKARDGAIPCPDDAAKTISGRAKDFAVYGDMSHNLRLCDSASTALSTKSFLTVLQSWGYGSVGEINLVNGGYGNGAYLYTVAGSKKTWQTWTYSTTGHGMVGWKSSSSHWNVIIGSYDRVGCGGWASGSTYYYNCLFARGGPNGTKAPPTNSPFNNPLPAPKVTPPPAAKATPPPTARQNPPTTCGSCATATSFDSSGPTLSSDPSADASATDASAAPTSFLQGAQAGAATDAPDSGSAAGIQGAGDGAPPAEGASGLAGSIARVVALVAGSGAAILYGCYAFLSLKRRRRRETAL